MKTIERLLNECEYWAKAEYARFLGKNQAAINHAITRWITPKLQKEYTLAFNQCFETNYSFRELFKEES